MSTLGDLGDDLVTALIDRLRRHEAYGTDRMGPDDWGWGAECVRCGEIGPWVSDPEWAHRAADLHSRPGRWVQAFIDSPLGNGIEWWMRRRSPAWLQRLWCAVSTDCAECRAPGETVSLWGQMGWPRRCARGAGRPKVSQE